MRFKSLLTGIAAGALIATSPIVAPTAWAQESEAASPEELLAGLEIDYDVFTLPNGLRTIVHTDRKSPVVGVTVYYRVGAKHEPRGSTGFAHLFEHLMFMGSENVDNFDIPLEAAGSTPTNGSTNADRTNYVETVPTGALDLALMMESDRMGHLLGAIDQEDLDKQRGVVQNEKRQGDNQPYGLTRYLIQDGLFPVGHPYRHSTIGSMADLSAASLTDVRNWFIENYGPNNVVLVLAGDIDVATARAKVERWFGDIPRGPDVEEVSASPVTLAADVERTHVDQVPLERIYRLWTGPGMEHPDAPALDAGMRVLGGLSSARLTDALVREQQLATSAAATNWQSEDVSVLMAWLDLKPGADRAQAEASLDAEIAKMIAEGPSQAELDRAATVLLSQTLDGLERVGGFSSKGTALAEGLLYTGDADFSLDVLKRTTRVSPSYVRDAMARWMSRPVYKLSIVPGERTEDGALLGGWGDEDQVAPPAPDAKAPVAPLESGPPRPMPEPEPVGELTFPAIETATLSNGVEVVLARRTAVPKLVLDLAFDAGHAVDGQARAGAHSLMMEALEEGTAEMGPSEIAQASERLGASISAFASLDRSHVRMNALTANLRPSLELMADIALAPAFREEDVERLKSQRLANIAQQLASPGGMASRAMAPILYGPDHPYGNVGALGAADVVEGLTAADLREEHGRWLRPDLATITVVGDVTMDVLTRELEAVLGDWQAPATAAPTKSFDLATPAPSTRLFVIDRPNSPQSVILASRVLPFDGTQEGLETLELANEVLGNGFLSRLNQLIREEKGWSYGARSAILRPEGPAALTVSTAVQSDRTADSVRAITQVMSELADGTRGVDAVEFARVTDGNIRGLPNNFQTNSQVLGALLSNELLDRPYDYQLSLPGTYRGIDVEALDAAAASLLGEENLTMIIVGDRAQIDAQIETLDLEPTYLDASDL